MSRADVSVLNREAVIARVDVHNDFNRGTVPARLVGVYGVEKGQPLATPAAAPAQ